MGKIDPSVHPDFVRFYSDGRQLYLRKEVYEALQMMIQDARKDGISLFVVSAFRSFNDQKNIWESKWQRFALSHPEPKNRCLWILRYSSAPGTSRHHWGTDVDLVSVDPAFFQTSRGKKILSWLEKNASRYGFERPYTSLIERKKGYQEEPWHWSYAPLAKGYLALYTNSIQNEDITDFAGSEVLKEIDLWEYVLGINPLLLP
ncbi:M15 family metallopeptidase [Thermospira aquatica]|uniref:M15 family metallopeptidase n=1 Tax=Thermospira aquatica TaxID=2828656 RepID=A0AAX3BDH3_9SPIR|nr:M15 family metallopeptidase [Thermospira aquatica]URA10104.1 M15 family metallopeptidase [Thermospira aquatica]